MYKKQVKLALDALRDSLVSLGANPYRIDLPRPAGVMKVGVDDFLVANSRRAKKAFEELEHHPLFLSEGITGAQLLQKNFVEPSWIVPGFIAQGLTLFAGKPKIGKSWLVLSLITSLSSGKGVFGKYETQEPIEAAYLALEDSELRLQKRLKKLGVTNKDVEGAHFFCKWNSIEEGGHLALERWLNQNPKCRIVFIDTLAKVRAIPKSGNAYYEDYEAASALKEIADKFNVAIVVVHHVRKQASDDPFDMISGTNGISGCADTNFVLLRDRGNVDGVLHITGRDIDEQELAMSFNDCVWKVVGDASYIQATATQNEILLLLLEFGEEMTPTQIARHTDRSVGGLSKTLRKMVNDGLLERLKGGKYRPKAQKTKKYELKGRNKNKG